MRISLILFLVAAIVFAAGCDSSKTAIKKSDADELITAVDNELEQADGDAVSIDKICKGISCSDHGQCKVKDNKPYCECNEGFMADGLACVASDAEITESDTPVVQDNETVLVDDGDVKTDCKGINCSGFGQCKIDTDTNLPYCACIDGYVAEGLTCVPYVDPCKGVSCSNKGSCVVEGGAAKCNCNIGYHAEGLECIKDVTDPCAGQTCSDHGTCVVDNNTAKCQCENGYKEVGLTCVEDTSAEICKGVYCSGKGTCVSDAGNPKCNCVDGYSPQDLECLKDGNPCEGITCSDHGICDPNKVPVECVCDNNYEAQGLSCVASGNACLGIACSGHGSCQIDVGNNAVCVCDSGYEVQGFNCLLESDPCKGITCSEHGKCDSTSGYAVCACDTGYHTQNFECVKDNDPCEGVVCSGHGACAVENGNAKCNCDAGFVDQGLFCIKDTNPCEGITCSSHGTCDGTTGTAFCKCESGYYVQGFECVKEGNPCDGVTCSGHGTCDSTSGNAVCSCEAGYFEQGFNCLKESDPCEGITCSAHGTCDSTGGYTKCVCEDGYHSQGFECLKLDNPCDGITCSGFGTCQADPNNNAYCSCDSGYHPDGLNCVLTADPCAGVDCSGHGECSSVNGNPVCACDILYTGQTCSSCVADYHMETGQCVYNTRIIDCTVTLPDNAQWTTTYSGYKPGGKIEQTWSTALQKYTPEADTCEWACLDTFCLDGVSTCSQTKSAQCANIVAPINAHQITAQVTLSCNSGVWSLPVSCEWECNTNYHKDGSQCVINEISQNCINSKPANSIWTTGNIGGVEFSNGQFKRIWDSGQSKYLPEAADCPWECATTFCLTSTEQCAQSIQEQCDAAGVVPPAHAVIDYKDITINCVFGGWETTPKCGWKCDTGYVENGGQCSDQVRWVSCDTYSSTVKPANSIWSPSQTEVYDNGNFKQQWDGSAYAPATFDCPWICSDGYHKNGSVCDIDVKWVACANTLPANAQWTGENSGGQCKQTWSGSVYLPAPCNCTWACSGSYFGLGGVCVNPDGDEDGDGLTNAAEDVNRNGVVDSGETDPLNADTDGDGLSDGAEKNTSHTDPLKADTDGDGISDYVEVNSDYVYKNASGTVIHGKTDPLKADTDSDSLGDGAEDINHNGALDYTSNNGYYIDPFGDQVLVSGSPIPVSNVALAQAHLCPCNYHNQHGCVYPAESNPVLVDSDCNGINDNNESGATVCKAENLANIDSHTNSSKNFNFALLHDTPPSQLGFGAYSPVSQTLAGQTEEVGAVFYDGNANHDVAGFILTTSAGSGVIVGGVSYPDVQRNLDLADLQTIYGSTAFTSNIYTQFVTWDGYKAERMEVQLTTSSMTLKALTNDLIRRVSAKTNVGSATFTGLFSPTTSPTSTTWKIIWETVVKEIKNVTRVVTIVPVSNYNGDRPMIMNDVAGGGSIGDFAAQFRSFCQSFEKTGSSVDIIWVVDNSGSMSAAQNAVSAAASIMSNTLSSTAGLDWRIAVTTTDQNFYSKEYDCGGSDTGCYQAGYDCNCDQWGSCSTCYGWFSDYGDGVFVMKDRFTRNISEFQSWVQLGTGGDGASEQGDRMAKRAIERHWTGGTNCTHADKCIRADAKLVVVVLSDENAHYICQDNDSCAGSNFSQPRFDEIKNFIKGKNATYFSITYLPGTSGSYCTSEGIQDTVYRDLAIATGGTSGTICGDQNSNIQAITNAIAYKAGKYLLSFTPMSSSIKVGFPKSTTCPAGSTESNGVCWVNRSTSNGFDYNALENKILFFGSVINNVNQIAVSYKYWYH